VKKKFFIFIVFLVILALAGLSIYLWAQGPYKEIEKITKNLQTEKEVIEVFGQPYKTVYKGSEDYYVKGYSFKEREIQNKVHIFFPKNRTDAVADIILYVYIGADGQVEDYFVGGS